MKRHAHTCSILPRTYKCTWRMTRVQPCSFLCTQTNTFISSHMAHAHVFASVSETDMFVFLVLLSTSRHRFKWTRVRHHHYEHFGKLWFLGQSFHWVISKIQTLHLSFYTVFVRYCAEMPQVHHSLANNQHELQVVRGVGRSVCVFMWTGVYFVCISSKQSQETVSFSDDFE